jgi:hypothetical protein
MMQGHLAYVRFVWAMSRAQFISPNSTQWAPSGGEVCLQVSRQEKDRQTDRQTDMHLVARTRESKRDANAEGASASNFLRSVGFRLQAQHSSDMCLSGALLSHQGTHGRGMLHCGTAATNRHGCCVCHGHCMRAQNATTGMQCMVPQVNKQAGPEMCHIKCGLD